MIKAVNLILVEDDPEIHESLTLLFKDSGRVHLSKTFYSSEDILADPLKDAQVVLMDISLPGMNGIECVKALKSRHENLEFIMLTVHQDDKLVFDSLCAGACGYLLKNTDPDRIIDSIIEVANGGAPMSTKIARMIVNSFQTQKEKLLTTREKEVLFQLCKGKSYKMIADTLFISEDTVRSHLKNIYKKLHVNSKSEAVAKALKERLI